MESGNVSNQEIYKVILVDTDATILDTFYGKPGDIIKLPKAPNIDKTNENLAFDDWCCAYEFGVAEDGCYTVTIRDEDIAVGALWSLNTGAAMEITILPFSGEFKLGFWDPFSENSAYDIDWDDGSVERVILSGKNDNEITHIYTEEAERKITFTAVGEHYGNLANGWIKNEDMQYEDDMLNCAFNHPTYIKSIRFGNFNYSNTKIYLNDTLIPSLCENNKIVIQEIIIPTIEEIDIGVFQSNVSSLVGYRIQIGMKTWFLKAQYMHNTQSYYYFYEPDIEYCIFGSQLNDSGMWYGFLDHSNIKLFNFTSGINYVAESFWACQNLQKIVWDSASTEASFINCKNLEEIKFRSGSAYDGFTGTPKLKTVIFEEGCEYVEFNPHNNLYPEYSELCGVEKIILPSTIKDFYIEPITANFVPNLKFIDLQKAEVLPNIEIYSYPEANVKPYNYNPTILVNKNIVNEYKTHSIWGQFDIQIIQTFNDKMTALADSIREKSNIQTPLSIDAMKKAVDEFETEITGLIEEGTGEYAVIIVDTDAKIIKKIWGNAGDTIILPKDPGYTREDEDLVFSHWCSMYELVTTLDGFQTVTLVNEDIVVGAIWKLPYDGFQIETLSFNGEFSMNIAIMDPIIINWGDGETETIQPDFSQYYDPYTYKVTLKHSYLNNTKHKIIMRSIIKDSTVTTLPENAFNQPEYITAIKISDWPGYFVISSNALSGLSNLELIILGSDTSLDCFNGDYPKLKTVFFDTYISGSDYISCFFQMNNLEYFIFSYYHFIHNTNAITHIHYFLNYSNIKYFNFPPIPISFADSFQYCNNLTSITIQNQNIGWYSLYGCENLKEIKCVQGGIHGGVGENPQLERIVGLEGNEVMYIALGGRLPLLKYIICPSTLQSFDLLDFGGPEQEFILDLSKVNGVPDPMVDIEELQNGIENDDWFINDTVQIIVNEDWLEDYINDPVWGLYKAQIVGHRNGKYIEEQYEPSQDWLDDHVREILCCLPYGEDVPSGEKLVKTITSPYDATFYCYDYFTAEDGLRIVDSNNRIVFSIGGDDSNGYIDEITVYESYFVIKAIRSSEHSDSFDYTEYLTYCWKDIII